MSLRRTYFFFLATSLGAGALLFGQGVGSIHGVVTDPSDLPISNASVQAKMVERGLVRTARTNESGSFILPSLPVGTYIVLVEQPGFKHTRREGIELTANENVRVDARLELGGVAEQVSVIESAPPVDVRSSVIGLLVDSRRVMDLPINGRNIIGLAQMLPGVAEVRAPQTFTGDRDGPTVAVGGSRPNQNLFLFDGAHHNALFRNTGLNFPPPDALQEVKVLTNSFSAEYGRNAGAVFNVVSKSGTNQVHGSLWEFYRNQKLNARNFFAPSRKPQLNQNQFGAAAGGPIRKNQLFVFGSYEGLRIRPEALSATAFPLTEAERRGDFSSSRTAVRDPLTNQPFPNNLIPPTRVDTVAGNVLSRNLMPLPNLPNNQLQQVFPRPQDNDQFLVRLDYNLGRHTIDGRYNYDHATSVQTTGQVPSYTNSTEAFRDQNVTIGDTMVITPRLLNQVRASFHRLYISSALSNPFHISDLGGNFPRFGPTSPPNLVISGRVTLGGTTNMNPGVANETLQIGDSLTWSAGSHSLKAGFDLHKSRYLNYTEVRTMGAFTFSGQLTGNAAADFLIGRPSSMEVSTPVREQGGKQTSTYYYIQDDWKLHPRLTLNLGLRYELPLPWYHPNNFWGTLIPGRQSQVIPNAPLGLLFPGDPGIPRGLVPTDKNNLAPRFGFAWDPFGRGRTSIRGAYGIFYETMNADIIQNEGQPFSYTFTIPTPFSLTDPLRGQAPIPLTTDLRNPLFVGLQQISYPDPTLRTGYVQQFNLNVQQQAARNLVVQVGYVGRTARKLMLALSSNPAVYRPGATLGNINQRRLLPDFGNNRIISTPANAAYHSLQLEVNKRFSGGFSVQGAYTFSRSIDMASGITTGLAAAPPNLFDLRSQWSLSDFHSKHITSLSWIWDLPGGGIRSRTLRALAHGWQANGLVSLRSGRPINVLTGRDDALSGTTNQRPDVIGEHRLSGDRSRGEKIQNWFSRPAFAFPAPGVYGNVGRNALIGPAAANVNIGVFKDYILPGREGLRLQLRSEFFNLFNSVSLGTPEARLSAASMGLITSAAEARVIQFALKILF